MQSIHFMLVHGAWHNAWCWARLTPLLENQGHHVSTPSLPQNHRRPVGLKDYAECIATLLQQQAQPVVLVGHSMAGLVISQVAEWMPEAIQQLIYVAAYVPKHGESLVSIAEQSKSRGVSPYLEIDAIKSEIRLRDEAALKALFYEHCTVEDQAWAYQQLTPQPLQPFLDTVYLGENFLKVKKTAIICENDLVLLAEDQRQMATGVVNEVVMLQADHSPFISNPADLSREIIQCL